MFIGRYKTLIHDRQGQSMIEFALVLPLFVLFIIGIFEIGRVFFSYIAITNATREGARVITFWPGKTTIQNVVSAVDAEIGTSPMVTVSNINSIKIECGNTYALVTSDTLLEKCPSQQPVRVTVTYNYKYLLSLFFNQPLIFHRSVEMMLP